jgi:hypothetical protein
MAPFLSLSLVSLDMLAEIVQIIIMAELQRNIKMPPIGEDG